MLTPDSFCFQKKWYNEIIEKYESVDDIQLKDFYNKESKK